MNDALAFGPLSLTIVVGARTELPQPLGSIVFAHIITVTVFGLLVHTDIYVSVAHAGGADAGIRPPPNTSRARWPGATRTMSSDHLTQTFQGHKRIP